MKILTHAIIAPSALALLVSAFGMLAACGDEGGDAAPVACAEGVGGKPVGCVWGKLTDLSGKPLAGIKVSACTDLECIRGDSRADGTYDIQGLAVAPHHIEVLGEPAGVFTMVWWQDVPAAVQSRLPEAVVLQPLAGATSVPLAPADGGKVMLADGQLELEVEPGALKYAAGTLDKSVTAIEIDVDDIPPFDIEPWKGKEDRTRAFVINPFPLKSSTGAKLRVLGEEGVAVSTPYSVYAADPIFGNLVKVGVMTADGSGALVTQPGGSIKDLTTIIVVPN